MAESELIIKRVREQYALCTSYVDMGISSVKFGSAVRTKRFETYFLRPDYFRFECQSVLDNEPAGHTFGIWSDGEQTRVKTSTVTLSPNLCLAIAGLTNASHGSVPVISSLLMADIRLNSLSTILDLIEPMQLEDAQVDSKPCYVLSGEGWDAGYPKLFISKTDYGIKRVVIEAENLASKSSRSASNHDEGVPVVFQHEYLKVIFDQPLDVEIFEFPWKE